MAKREVGGVYRIWSKVHPDRCYVGSTVNFKERFSEHKRLLRKELHNDVFQFHYNKYGLDDLVFDIIEECKAEDLLVREQFYLDTDPMNCYFNVCKVAGNCLGVIQSEETKQKRREANLGKKRPPFSEEHLANMRAAMKNRKHKEGYVSPLKGRPSPLKGRPMKEEQKIKLRVPKTASQKEGIKKGWIKRKERGLVGTRDESGQFIKKSN
jgi:group I intron endonuclease